MNSVPSVVDAAAPASRVIRRSNARDGYIASRFNCAWKAWVAIAASRAGVDVMRAIADSRLAHHLRCLRLLDAGFGWRQIRGLRSGKVLDDPALTDAQFDKMFDVLRIGRHRSRRYERRRRQSGTAA